MHPDWIPQLSRLRCLIDVGGEVPRRVHEAQPVRSMTARSSACLPCPDPVALPSADEAPVPAGAHGLRPERWDTVLSKQGNGDSFAHRTRSVLNLPGLPSGSNLGDGATPTTKKFSS